MDRFDNSMAPHFRELLAEREAALRSLLPAPAPAPDVPAEAGDFKDLAQRECEAAVEEVQESHAVRELEEIAMARRRLAEHSYGYCRDCGDPIDLRRLLALPSTPLCTACQIEAERVALFSERTTDRMHAAAGRV